MKFTFFFLQNYRTGSQSNSIASFSEAGSSKSSSSNRCWSMKKSGVESSVAMDISQNVVVTAITSLGRFFQKSFMVVTPTGDMVYVSCQQLRTIIC